MTLRGRLFFYLVIILAAAILGWWWLSGDKPEPAPAVEQTGYLYIGLVIPRSGPLAPLGESMNRGADMAVEKLNSDLAAGVRKVKLVLRDEAKLADLPPESHPANDARIKVVVGHLTERSLEESQPVYVEKGLPVLLPVISDAAATVLGQGWFYQLMPSGQAQAGELARFALGELKARRFLVIHEDSKNGRLTAETFVREAGQGGGEVKVDAYPADPAALLALAEQAHAWKPDVVLLALHRRPAIFIAQALAKAGSRTTILGTHSLAVNDVVTLLERLSDQAFVAVPVNPLEPGPAASAFTELYVARYHGYPDWLACQTYDAVVLAAEALRKGGESPKQIKSYLDGLNAGGKGFAGLAGEYYFKEQAAVRPVCIIKMGPSLVGRLPQ